MKLNPEEKVDDQLASTLMKNTRPLIVTLASLWTEIGLTSAEVEERCGVVDTEVVGLLEQMVAEEERNKESLISRRLKLKFQTQNLAEQMNIICDEQPNPEKTLRDQVLNLSTLLEKLNKEKDKRLSQWQQLKMHNEQYCKLLEFEVEVPRLEDELLDDSELITRELPPSLSQLELFEVQVNSLAKQLQDHRKIVSEMKCQINTLVMQLQYQVLLKSEQSMVQALSESSVVSNDVMNKHHNFINKLNAKKYSNKQQISALKQQLKSDEEEEDDDVKNIPDDDFSFKTLNLLQEKLVRKEALKAQAKRQVTPKRYGRSKSTTPCLTPTSKHNQAPEVSTARRSLKNKLANLTPSKIAAKLKSDEGDKGSKDRLLTPKHRTDTPKRRAPSTPNLKGPSAPRVSHNCVTPQPLFARPSRNRLREESEQKKLVRKPPINKNTKPTNNNINAIKLKNNDNIDFRHYLMEKENVASSYEEFTRGLRECDRDFISSSILVPPPSQRVPKSPFHLS